jgi:hypothetical protein
MKNKGVAKAGIVNEIVSLGVKLERRNWRMQTKKKESKRLDIRL